MSDKTSYYEDQLKQIITNGKYPARVQISGPENHEEYQNLENHTKWMDLNPTSVKVLIKWLADKFILDGTP